MRTAGTVPPTTRTEGHAPWPPGAHFPDRGPGARSDRRAPDAAEAGLPGPVATGRFLLWAVAAPLVALLAATALFRWTNLDVALSERFYDPWTGKWPLRHVQPWSALYEAGPYPGLLLGIGGFAVAAAGLFWARLRPYRDAGLVLGLLLALAPGLLVNAGLKDHWGRPRPCQVDQFGGDHAFHAVWEPGDPGDCRSFPCGHAAMGFYLMAPAFLLYPRNRRLALAFLVLGLSGGILMGTARIVQGRHFASDVVWSAALVYFTGLALGYVHHVRMARKSTRAEAGADVLPMPAERRDYPRAA